MKLTTKFIVLLVLLRITVGWHFLYEGLWKLEQDALPETYVVSRSLVFNATSGLRGFFDAALKDPASIDKLTVPAAQARCDQWYNEIVNPMPTGTLGDDQKGRLMLERDRAKDRLAAVFNDRIFQMRLAGYRKQLAAGEADPLSREELRGRLQGAVNFDPFAVRDQVLKMAEDKSNRFNAQAYLQASHGPFRWFFRSMIADANGVKRLDVKAAQARIDERHNEILEHYREAGTPFTEEQKNKLGAIRDKHKAWMDALFQDPQFLARLEDHQRMLERVGADSNKLNANFTQERLISDRGRLDKVTADLTGYVTEPLIDLGQQAQKLCTPQQLTAGAVDPPSLPTCFIDWCIKWGLVFMGLSMLLGLFTPMGLAAAAVQLTMFYLATPPWPGLPVAPDGGHYLYVDRNLIELFVVLVLLAANTGRYGLDSLMEKYVYTRLRARRQAKSRPAPAQVTATGTNQASA